MNAWQISRQRGASSEHCFDSESRWHCYASISAKSACRDRRQQRIPVSRRLAAKQADFQDGDPTRPSPTSTVRRLREDHTGEGEPANTIVAVGLDEPGTSPGRVLADGHDFFCSARLSPDANHLVWLAWDHPNMPWNGTTLYLADIGADGAPADERVIAGGVAELVFQPEWSPDGNEIIFVSDRTGWWNVYAYELATGTTRPLCPTQAEFGAPQWNLGMSTYAFAGARRIVCAYTKAGLGQLATLDLASGSLEAIETGSTEFGWCVPTATASYSAGEPRIGRRPSSNSTCGPDNITCSSRRPTCSVAPNCA